MTTTLHQLSGTFTPSEVERLFIRWRDDNTHLHRYSIHFVDDGRAACQFDQLKFNWFEVSASDLFVSHNY